MDSLLVFTLLGQSVLGLFLAVLVAHSFALFACPHHVAAAMHPRKDIEAQGTSPFMDRPRSIDLCIRSTRPASTFPESQSTLICEPRFSTPCEMRFFPREKGKMALVEGFSLKRPLSLSRVGKIASRRG